MLLSVMFSNTLFYKNSTDPWVYFCAPHLTRQRKFYTAFFFQIAEIPQGRALEYTLTQQAYRRFVVCYSPLSKREGDCSRNGSPDCFCYRFWGRSVVGRIDLVTVLEANLTSWQPREKLQYLYENLMSNNFM